MEQETGVRPSDLVTRRINTVIFTATTDCNLRCTYCGVSTPTYVGKTFDFSQIGRVAEQMAAAGVKQVQINGHGETTMLPGWGGHCAEFLNRGVELSITSNFSTILTEEEVDVMARMTWITISIDTVDRDLLRAIRRKVDVRTVLYNMAMIRLQAVSKYHKNPKFVWQCTLSDLVVEKLMDWLLMGYLNGVRIFNLGNLIEVRELPAILAKEGAVIPKHIANLDRRELIRACQSIADARRFAEANKVELRIQPGTAEGVIARLATFGITAPEDFKTTFDLSRVA